MQKLVANFNEKNDTQFLLASVSDGSQKKKNLDAVSALQLKLIL